MSGNAVQSFYPLGGREPGTSQSETNFFALVETSLTSMILVDTEGSVLYANPATEKLLDRDREALIDRPFGFPLLAMQSTEIQIPRQHSLATAEMQVAEMRWDGQKSYLVSLHDITPRKQAEEALRQSERFLRSTLDGLSANIALLDDQGEILLVNKAWRDFAGQNGVSPETVSEGTNYLQACEIVSKGDDEGATAFTEGIRKVLEAKSERFVMEYPCNGPDIRRWFIGRVTPLRGDGPRRVVVAHEDITERKRLEQMKEDVEHILHHDLRSPLNGLINGPLQIMEDKNLTLDQRELLRLVAICGRKMLSEINSSLELHKIESGTYSFEAIECDLFQLVRDNIDSLALGVGFEPGHVVICNHQSTAGKSDPRLQTDISLLDTILTNVLRNALEAGGLKTQVFVDLFEDAEGCVIAVRNAQPVPLEIREHFFDKYATFGKMGGTGLGTYSAYIMTRALGGTIEMDTSEEKGTTVTLRIPTRAMGIHQNINK